MKISVIVPVFDSERTLGSCLSSVFEAEYCDFEVIVVDDHSNDNSRAIARTMPCKLIELPINGGPAAARNCGAAAASGSLLFFLDADILIRPDSLGRVAGMFARRPDIAALFGSYQADTPSPDFFSQYTRTCFITIRIRFHIRRRPRLQAGSVRCGPRSSPPSEASIRPSAFLRTSSSVTACTAPAIAYGSTSNFS